MGLISDSSTLPDEGAIVLTGLLLRSDSGRVKIVVGDLCLTIDEEDVMDIEEIVLLPEVVPGLAIPVQCKVRRPMRVLSVSSSHVYRNSLLGSRRPFAVSSRVEPVVVPEAPTYRQLEEVFLRKRGIEA